MVSSPDIDPETKKQILEPFDGDLPDTRNPRPVSYTHLDVYKRQI